jgi:hypothetical protein
MSTDRHQERCADVLVAQMGESGVAELMQRLPTALTVEKFLSTVIRQPCPARDRVQITFSAKSRRVWPGWPAIGNEHWPLGPEGDEFGEQAAGCGLEVQRAQMAATGPRVGLPVDKLEVGDVQAEGVLGMTGRVVEQPP